MIGLVSFTAICFLVMTDYYLGKHIRLLAARLDELEQKQDRCPFCAVMQSQAGSQAAGVQQ